MDERIYSWIAGTHQWIRGIALGHRAKCDLAPNVAIVGIGLREIVFRPPSERIDARHCPASKANLRRKTRVRIPNPKHQAPNPKNQTPNLKHQTPDTKYQINSRRLALSKLWGLGFVVWLPEPIKYFRARET